MKHTKKVLICFLVSTMLYACSSTNYLTLSVKEPAPVYLPSAIRIVGIVDRSLPVGKNKKMDNLDKILSAEGENMDKDGAHACIMGLNDELINTNRFDEVKIIENEQLKSPGLGIFPSALSWEEVEEICLYNKVEALFVLSFYDTDTKIDYKTIPIEIDGPLGVKIPAIETHVTLTTLIKTGWRIYDPTHKIIRDKYFINETIVSTGRGINPLKAAEAIIGRREGILQTSNNIGHNYAPRIFSYSLRVRRSYFVRGTNNFKIAQRKAQIGDWDGAAQLWEKEVSNPKNKVAGRACYNMAIINEINADLNTAVDWASKAYADYEIKIALQYLKVLKNRIETNKQLKLEMEN